MRINDIIRHISKLFERKRKNPIQLDEDSNLESNLKFLKVDKISTPIQISEDTVNIQGTLNVNGSAVQTGLELDTGATELNELSDVTYSSGDLTIDSLDKIVAADFVVDSGASIELDSDNGRFIAKKSGTEFSSENSAYAGMILGYTCIGADVADDNYVLTTSYFCFTDSGGTEISTTFKTPPSEDVEIEVELYFSSGSGASDLFLTLSDNASYPSNSLHHKNQHEKLVITPSRGWGGTITQKFLLNQYHLNAIGVSNTIYIAAKSDSVSGAPVISWGGDASGDYTNLVMKATALPATIVVGS